jgi:hypothetical protein
MVKESNQVGIHVQSMRSRQAAHLPHETRVMLTAQRGNKAIVVAECVLFMA